MSDDATTLPEFVADLTRRGARFDVRDHSVVVTPRSLLSEPELRRLRSVARPALLSALGVAVSEPEVLPGRDEQPVSPGPLVASGVKAETPGPVVVRYCGVTLTVTERDVRTAVTALGLERELESGELSMTEATELARLRLLTSLQLRSRTLRGVTAR